ncbi:permease [Flavimarina sp. Hel_I_48]|uniref:permease n=1 Tax=Flavimarina sp. Hel_I_48 TaxID=1392488 RepID=UPI000691F0D8|nr:permease [Flavimarina sp. Hel_I_48]
MDVFTLQKSLLFIVFIGIGLLLKYKFNGSAELNGVKKIILNLALPATIFIALMGIQVKIDLLILPVLALFLNIILFFIFPYILPALGIKKGSPKYRTAQLLIPSLAPGLSCFPFILEFLGENYLAKAAMADLGNKIFVLLILYVVAMRFYYALNKKNNRSNKTKIKELLIALVSEPVNLFIGAALLLVCFGINMKTLPFVIGESMQRLSLMMTPLVLLYIGLAVNIKKEQFFQIFGMLSLRAGFAVFFAAMIIAIIGLNSANDILLLLVFSLSSCSFWPFAHIAAVETLEKEDVITSKRTFNADFAIGLLALSFPFSVLVILGVLSSGTVFTSVSTILVLGAVLSIPGIAYIGYNYVSKIALKGNKSVKTAYNLPIEEGS